MVMKQLEIATRLLQRFGVNESLIGDLIERCQRGGSSRWLLRQTSIAIALRVRVPLVCLALIVLATYTLLLLSHDWLRVLISVWFLAYVWSGFGIVLLSLADRR